jgi:putative SOS response-associated peptidase YedK
LVPWWAKDVKIGARCINAMSETVASKPAFRDPFARGQRCIVPVDAFYEWKKIGAAKQPYAIVGADGLPLALRGCGSAGRTGRPARRCKPSRSSRRRPTSFAAPSMTACRSSYRVKSGPLDLGSARLIRTSCGG